MLRLQFSAGSWFTIPKLTVYLLLLLSAVEAISADANATTNINHTQPDPTVSILRLRSKATAPAAQTAITAASSPELVPPPPPEPLHYLGPTPISALGAHGPAHIGPIISATIVEQNPGPEPMDKKQDGPTIVVEETGPNNVTKLTINPPTNVTISAVGRQPIVVDSNKKELIAAALKQIAKPLTSAAKNASAIKPANATTDESKPKPQPQSSPKPTQPEDKQPTNKTDVVHFRFKSGSRPRPPH